MTGKTDSQRYFWIGLAILLLPYLAWFIAGENSFVLPHDNLDSEFVYIKLLLQSGNALGLDLHGEIPQIMDGIPRTLFRSGFNVTFLFFALFPPIYAYIVNHLVVHLIGYVGMYALLRRYFRQDDGWLVPAIALCFGFVSYYHIQYGISIAGQPLLLFAFLNLLYDRAKWYDWGTIIGFPFFSFMVVTLPFFVPLLLLIALLQYRKTRKIPYLFAAGLAVLCVTNLLVEFNLVYSTFINKEIVSHRSEWNRLKIIGYPNFKLFLYYIFVDLQRTQYHAGTFSTIPILAGLAIAKLVFRIRLSPALWGSALLVGFIAFWDAFNGTLIYLLRDHVRLVEQFSTERFFFIGPLAWLLLLASILVALDLAKPLQRYFAMAVVAVTFCGIAYHNQELTQNLGLLFTGKSSLPTFKEYFAEDVFAKIKQDLGEENVKRYNTLSIRISPTVAQYNGFNTLDSYQNNYELRYKLEFRKIIAKELEKDPVSKSLFDNMGSSCYALTSESTDYVIARKDEGIPIQNLEYDLDQARAMHCKYILSSLPILNAESQGMKIVGSYDTPESYYRIHVYEI